MANILVVDDEELARYTLQEILEDAGHTVHTAEDGEAGLRAAQAERFDLVITDIIMPKKEGVETIIELKRDHPNLQVIAISGGGRTRNLDFLDLAKEYGADAILAKPFNEKELLNVVNERLRTRLQGALKKD